MSAPEYPELAQWIFRDLARGENACLYPCPPNMDRQTYEWVRECVMRLRRYVVTFGPIGTADASDRLA